jgi:hypothetical protein
LIKADSSAWAKTLDGSLRTFYWQNGYGAFSVSQSNADAVRRYIATQEDHRRRHTFQDEYRKLLEKHGIAYDERYVWD